jgi:hypothetical protein
MVQDDLRQRREGFELRAVALARRARGAVRVRLLVVALAPRRALESGGGRSFKETRAKLALVVRTRGAQYRGGLLCGEACCMRQGRGNLRVRHGGHLIGDRTEAFPCARCRAPRACS